MEAPTAIKTNASNTTIEKTIFLFIFLLSVELIFFLLIEDFNATLLSEGTLFLKSNTFIEFNKSVCVQLKSPIVITSSLTKSGRMFISKGRSTCSLRSSQNLEIHPLGLIKKVSSSTPRR